MITIPTISQLYNAILNDLETEMGTSIPLFGKIFLRGLAAVQAAKLKLYYISLGKVQKNIFIDTADPEATGGTLERFGRIKLGRDPFPAQAGQYVLNITGSIGATVPAGTTFKSNDDSLNPGKMFILDVAYVLVAEADNITVRALSAGTVSRLIVDDELTATAPIPNVNSVGVVDAEAIPPLDAEATEEYRGKGIAAYQLEPNGGAVGDFRLWAADVQGVARVYPYAKTGASAEMNLFVEANPGDSTDGFGTPSPAMLAEVESVVELDPDVTKPINERGRRPLGIFDIDYLPVTIRHLDIEISDFVGLTPDIETSILNAVNDALTTVRPFIAGADVLELKNDIFNTNIIISIILTVRPGSSFGTVVLKVDGIDVPSFTFIDGDIPHLDSITYL
jgi:hypothetical protein